MLVLSLDTSTEAATAAIIDEDKLYGEITINYKKQHSVILMPMVDELFKNLQLSKDAIDGFVLSKGPGSFTGLRIGAATIKGLAHGLNKPFISVSSLDALAYNMAYTKGIICPIMDALRGNVYNATYKFEGDNLIKIDDYRVITLDTLLEEFSSRNEQITFIGDAVSMYKEKIQSTIANCHFAPQHLNVVKAAALGELGITRLKSGEFDDLTTFSPMYLVLSQAERELAKKKEVK